MSELLAPPVKRGRGRPTNYTQELANEIAEAVRKGLSPTRAGSLVGINHATIGEWRTIYPEFASALDQAESEYVADRVAALRACETKWGTPDPKALEIELRRFSEFRQHQEVTSTSTSVSLTVNVDPASMAQLQARHAERLQRLVGVPICDKSEPILTVLDTSPTVLPPESR